VSFGHSANRSFVVSRQNPNWRSAARSELLQGGGEQSMRKIHSFSRRVSELIERLVSPSCRHPSVASATSERNLTSWDVARQRPRTNREFAEAAMRVFRTLR
jgi:hypothetical protein